METMHNMSPMVNFSQASSFSQLPDEDFLALLQKEFPNGSYDFSSINPQNILNYPLPTLTPPSEDSSPSPPSTNNDSTSPTQADDDGVDQVLKRKASDEDLEEGPSQKNQHTRQYLLYHCWSRSSLYAVQSPTKRAQRRLHGASCRGQRRLVMRFQKFLKVQS